MATHDLNRFLEIEKACGNKYLAINMLSRSTRELSQNSQEYHLLDSKLLEWVVTGQAPYSDEILELRKQKYEILDDLDDLLVEVSDEEVVDTVKMNYKLSVQNKKLTLKINPLLSKSEQSRANILLRMIWYNFNK